MKQSEPHECEQFPGKRRKAAQIAGFAHADCCTQAVWFVLICHTILLGWSACWQSPTSNEPAHLASGVAIWELGRFDVYRVNPPLVRAIASLPVVLNGCKTNWNNLRSGPHARPEFLLGADFINVNRIDSIRLLNLARLTCLPFSLLGAWCCYQWGRALCNPLSGLLSCILWCFSPNILAAGQVICPDMGGASLGLAASFLFWQWLKTFSWNSAMLCGALLGLALLARSSWIILFAIWSTIWFIAFLIQSRNTSPIVSARRQIVQITLLFSISLYILNSGYLFDGTLTRLGDFEFVSQQLGNPAPNARSGNIYKDSNFASVPVPLPKEFVLGLDQQKKDFEAFPHASYLRGEWRMSGWWYYYLYGFLVKVPVGVLCLVLISICVFPQTNRRIEFDQLVGWMSLCLPGLVTAVILSCQPSLNHHFRYALPAFGPLFVFAGSIPFTIRGWKRHLRLPMIAITMICVVSLVTTTLTAAPRFISFFNLIVGGTRQGHRHMIHSNLDWGQDLYFLKNWLQQQNIDRPIHLAYNGVFDPADLGINYVPATCGPRWMTLKPSDETSDLWVISVNYLVGDRLRLLPNCSYEEFSQKTPIHICGDTLYVYRTHHSRQ